MAELASQPTSVQSIYSWYANDKIFVNRRYQRKLVWTQLEKQKLVESIIKKYPVPAILLAERDEAPGTYEIIDGLQRLHAIVSFIENSFSTISGEFFDVDQFTTAKSRSDEELFPASSDPNKLSAREIGAFLDYPLAVSVMRNASENEINDVFDRINTYGHRLSDQERRQAGVRSPFSELIRRLACSVRGDSTDDLLTLSAMPSISIDLPMMKHGYDVRADEVFWVNQGILRSTDLRDSVDEQCIADIIACIVGGRIIERSKDALDAIYEEGSAEEGRLRSALDVYGADRFADEFKFCLDEILSVCANNGDQKLRNLIFANKTTNAFPAVFAVIFIAFHELIVVEEKKISSYIHVNTALNDLSKRIETGRKSTSPEERRRNVNVIKGLVQEYFIKADDDRNIYGSHSTSDVDTVIRRSSIELSHYELKQGIVTLSDERSFDENVLDKIVKTICAIANNGREQTGKIIIGVADKDADVRRIRDLDNIESKKINGKSVVGVSREAKILGITDEQYYSKIRNFIKDSDLSSRLKSDVLSEIDFNSYFGLGVIVVTIPPQSELSYVKDEIYWRNGDNTEMVNSPRQVAELAKRF